MIIDLAGDNILTSTGQVRHSARQRKYLIFITKNSSQSTHLSPSLSRLLKIVFTSFQSTLFSTSSILWTFTMNLYSSSWVTDPLWSWSMSLNISWGVVSIRIILVFMSKLKYLPLFSQSGGVNHDLSENKL